VGLCLQKKASSGSVKRIETASQKVSETSADSFDIRQFFTAPQTGDIAVLSEEQYSYDLDADERFMAQSHRMPVHSCERICNSRFQL
jgi:hypothetical protein